MSYIRDFINVTKGLALISRAYLRQRSNSVQKNWRTSTIQDVVDRSVRNAAEMTSSFSATTTSSNFSNSGRGLQGTIRDTAERLSTAARGLQQGAAQFIFDQQSTKSATDDRSPFRPLESLGISPSKLSPSTSIEEVEAKTGLHPSVETELILNLPPDERKSVFEEKLGPKTSDPDVSKRRAEEIHGRFVEKYGQVDENQFLTTNSTPTTMASSSTSGVNSTTIRPQQQQEPTVTEADLLLTPTPMMAAELTNQRLADRQFSSQQLNESSRERRVPSSRIGRAATFANLAVGLAAGTVAEMTKKSLGLRQNDRMGLFDNNPILSEANAERIVNTLCRVRGAALKLGQMLSIQDNSMISPQIQRIFERVRYSADFMPKKQVEKMLKSEWGDDWRQKFAEFDDRPFAAASIGQVHRATLASDGRQVAVKIQYPGVAQSIDSDINNLVSVLTFGNILPRGLYLESFVKVAKVELAQECDYLLEAKANKRFRLLLANDPDVYIPEVIDELTTSRILCSELIYGLPVDKCVDLDQTTRDFIGKKVFELCLRELFEFNFMQTDPNWANFFYNSEKRQLILLDFGASREYSKKFVNQYMKIVNAAAADDEEKILQYSREIGFLTGYESKQMDKAHCEAVQILGEPFRTDTEFDFGMQNITPRIQRLIPIMVENRLTPPPEEMYSLHRKLSGTYLLCCKLKSRILCKPIFDEVCRRFEYSGKAMEPIGV